MRTKKQILLVDDDREFVASTRDLLESEGYEVRAVHDGATGIEEVRLNRPDLIVLDVMMTTDSEGFDVSRKLAENPEFENIPVIILTGIRTAKHLSFGFEPDENWLPVKAVLEKPVPPARFLQEVKKHLQAE